ncbi:MAG: preprotein translocase subunit SecA [Deltaproteobacteria bacterium]|nr:preprotein translocase subunit SecA [Deltaproteobacteria bacterium]RLB89231.1 MAG: preprotein translocase subunit SecA [Deltaproteobacteria bacterium]RLB96377.1 MAG: preprotein translocase subunit SecA [Deltaproteobacteria bacterium]RLC12770.1 MAG: preprotein translocase subunit SecA [Deltaproteobacteria bacterium]
MIGSLLKKVFGSKNERELNKLRPIVEQINALEPQMKSLSDDQLKAKTGAFREQIDHGATLDELLPEAFAVVREASVRTLSMRHFDVQLIGGIVLHQGKIAEMKTGEGKTLAATLPAYLNALTGKGVHIVTVNDYLARRDTEWMGAIYRFLGLTVGTVVHGLDDAERKAAYNADITYGTNNEFGFDYLRDNMKFSLDSMVQRGHHFAIVDEVDSILIDEARTPLIISGPVEQASNRLYEEMKPKVIKLKRHQDRLISNILNDALKELEQNGETDSALELLLRVKRGDPKNPRFLDLIAKQPALKKKLERLEGQLSAQKLLPKIDQDLYCTIEENQNIAEVTEKGLRLIYGGRSDDYIVPDLDEELRKIDENDKLTSLEKKIQRQKAEAFYRDASERFHVTRQLIKAYWLFNKDVQYVVKDGQVIIVDEFTGRMMPGRRWSDGLHQAVEAKEGVKVAEENQTLATITFQNYFRMYDKLAGMTGTADTEAAEFKKIYDLDVIVIPTNKPMIRIDYPDVIYKTEFEKFKAVVEEIKALHKKGQPVLVGTISIDKSEKLSRMLAKAGIKHEVLNAKNHEREAEIVAKAGQKGHVTISTNMAGRGTDIVLGEGVKELGGLHIIGTERHESRRIDNQLRGRSGRQGDAGSSRFYLSLEDDLLRIFGGERMSSIMERLGMKEGEPIEHGMISKAIENAQRKVEAHNFEIRKQLLEYDDVMNKQREVVYNQRREALSGKSLKPNIEQMIREVSENIAETFADENVPPDEWNMKGLREATYREFGLKLNIDRNTVDGLTREGLADLIFEAAMNMYEEKETAFGTAEFRELERMVLLQVVDNLWKEHLLAMDHLKQGIGLRGYAQQDPLVVYKKEGFDMFMDMIARIKEETVKFLFHIQIARPVEIERKEKAKLDKLSYSHGGESARQPVRRTKKKIGRNDPCPCGSGKKYKKCCGR